MTKAQLVLKVSNATTMDIPQAEIATQAVIDCLKAGIKEDGRVIIKDFGIFKVLDKAERKGRNPRTGESCIIHARKVVSFKSGKLFKNSLNEV